MDTLPVHPLNSLLRSFWRVSGHNIGFVSTCAALGGTEMDTADAHGAFRRTDAEDYYEISITELKAVIRGLLMYERTTTAVDINRFDLRYTAALWELYDLLHQAWMGEPVDWRNFRAHILDAAVEDQAHHWRVRCNRNDSAGMAPEVVASGRPSFTQHRRVPLHFPDIHE